MNDEQIDRMSADEKSAWIETLSDDEWKILWAPAAGKYGLVLAAQIKSLLLKPGATAHSRMNLLQALHRIPDSFVSADAIATIAPACATARQMFSELMTLPNYQVPALFWRQEPFSSFAALNPSLLDAIKLCNFHPHPRVGPDDRLAH